MRSGRRPENHRESPVITRRDIVATSVAGAVFAATGERVGEAQPTNAGVERTASRIVGFSTVATAPGRLTNALELVSKFAVSVFTMLRTGGGLTANCIEWPVTVLSQPEFGPTMPQGDKSSPGGTSTSGSGVQDSKLKKVRIMSNSRRSWIHMRRIAELAGFESMKRDAEKLVPGWLKYWLA
jgi:hypothetical protein